METTSTSDFYLETNPQLGAITMGLRVNTNIASLTAQRNLSRVTTRLQGNFSRLSSGLRIATAADDAAGLAISERMRSQIRSLGAATRNAQDGISLVQTAEGALNEVSNILSRMRELAVQASNGTLSTADHTTINTEVVALQSEIDRIAVTAEFNGIPLLNSATTVNIQVGINTGEVIGVNTADIQTVALGIDAANVNTTDVAAASASLTALDTAIGSINSIRGNMGASQNRLQSAVSSIMNSKENLSAAESRIRDVDVAFETADLTRNSILQQAATSVLQQANTQPQIALSLLQG
jgi:flagellin